MARVELDPAFDRNLARALAGPLGRIGRETARRAAELTPVRTGQSAASVEYEVDAAASAVRVGSRLLKYRFLEIGTRHMAARAPLRRAVDELAPSYPRMVARG